MIEDLIIVAMLDVSNHPRIPEALESIQQGRQPPRQEDEIIVEENQSSAGGFSCSLIVGRSKSAVLGHQDHAAVGRRHLVEPFAGAVGASVVHQDQLARNIFWPGFPQAPDHFLRELQVVVERGNERNLHAPN